MTFLTMCLLDLNYRALSKLTGGLYFPASGGVANGFQIPMQIGLPPTADIKYQISVWMPLWKGSLELSLQVSLVFE